MRGVGKKLGFPLVIILTLMFVLGVPAKGIEENNSAANPYDRLKSSVVLYIGSSTAYINNNKTFIDEGNPSVYPVIKGDITLVPLRFISEAFGAQVDWDDNIFGGTVMLADNTVSFAIGNNKIFVNGVEKSLEVPAALIGEKTYVPLRAISEGLNKNVFWDDRGLIIISDYNNTFNKDMDKALIDELAARFAADVSSAEQQKILDEYYMGIALDEAKQGLAEGEFPVGAVIVKDGKILAQTHNQVKKLKDVSAHAEMLAFRKASEVLNGKKPEGATIYVTLEPCGMDAGLIVQSRMKRLVFGADDLNGGGVGSRIDIPRDYKLLSNPLGTVEVDKGLFKDQAEQLIEEYNGGIK